MKKVVFSFDDGRLDFYRNVFPLLQKYNLKATLNVIPEFIISSDKYLDTISSEGAITIEQLVEIEKIGIVEIANHGYSHINSVEDIKMGNKQLKNMGINIENIGFASPMSYLTFDNSLEIRELISQKIISYIRTGNQVRREGLLYSFFSLLERITHSSTLFYLLNRRFIKHKINEHFYYSVSVTKYTTLKQIKRIIRCMKDDQILILCFHSILKEHEKNNSFGIWYWDYTKFEQLCLWLHKTKVVEVCTNAQVNYCT